MTVKKAQRLLTLLFFKKEFNLKRKKGVCICITPFFVKLDQQVQYG